ncbi:hypothetical protein LZ554_002901 [Drepanopeziza brunnea f. sp. 'monogermtubi']|nr:hypothetical protein LZ554_002901 [Drepanopeziza brunnea f. sp. 'monogermtubi']
MTDMDVLMDTNEEAHISNGAIKTGTVDPQVLAGSRGPETPGSTQDATDDGSQSKLQPTSQKAEDVAIRKAGLPTGCCYDDRMKFHANADFSSSPHHPEDPRRIEAIMTEFKTHGLILEQTQIQVKNEIKLDPSKYMWRIAAREATREEICTVHTASHFEWVRSLSQMSSEDLRQLTNDYDNGRKSLYVGNLTYEAALISAGGAIETCKNIVAGKVKNAIAVIRPPGHHAEHNESLGFCIFNNVPIAARICMADYPESCRKVLILDWDVHHGNGIQNIFYDDPNVLYISIHVYMNGTFYPGQPEVDGIPDGGLDKCGVGKGLGKNINIGWPEQGVGDGEYMAAFQRIVMPIAQEFDPDLVIVSAGFDAAAGDDLGGCWVSQACYSHMTHMLMSLANGKVAVCLEGGYNLGAISRSALAVARTLMGEPPMRLKIPPLNKAAAHTLDNVKRIQSAYWECMRPGVLPLSALNEIGMSRMSDIIRSAQKIGLAEKHDMIPLYIQRTKISRSFENQVLVTPELHKAKKILLIIHDPPQVYAQPDPYDNSVDAHNSFVTEGILPYIDWAVNHGFGVIDINCPQHISQPSDTDPYVPKPTEGTMGAQVRDLLCFIWDNYLELNRDANITLMGVGDAYFGIKQLLVARDGAKDKIAGILSFVTGALRPVKSETDPMLSRWYQGNSLIYVSPGHACWYDEDSLKKIKKHRFGKVEKADIVLSQGDVDGTGLAKMLMRHQADAKKFIMMSVRNWVEEKDEQEDTDEDELARPDIVMDDLPMGAPRSVRTPVRA